MPNNGLAARDLRLTIRWVEQPNSRSQGLISLVVSVLAGFVLQADERMQNSSSVLEVYDLRNACVVARRRFAEHRMAYDARERFADHVRTMDPIAYASADWQAELDGFT